MIQCIYNYINIHVYINMGFDIAHLQTLFALAIYIYVYDLAFHVFTVFDMAVNSFPQDLSLSRDSVGSFQVFVPRWVKITILLGK